MRECEEQGTEGRRVLLQAMVPFHSEASQKILHNPASWQAHRRKPERLMGRACTRARGPGGLARALMSPTPRSPLPTAICVPPAANLRARHVAEGAGVR